ncbi:ATP-binding protein [Micromonospora sp. M12]
MSRWEFVGRTDELNRLLAAVTGEAGRGLFFSGSAGIGKSRLLREGLGSLPTDRFAVWSIAASATTAALPFGGLVQVLPAEQPQGLSPPASCGGRSTCCNSRRPADASCSRSTTPTCSTRPRRHWCTWSPARRTPQWSAPCATVSRSRCRSAHSGPTTWSSTSS